MNLAVSMENSVKAALRADIKPAISQNWHDLARRQRCKFRLVASQLDPLAFLHTEAVSDVAVATLTPIDAITVTNKLTPPAL